MLFLEVYRSQSGAVFFGCSAVASGSLPGREGVRWAWVDGYMRW